MNIELNLRMGNDIIGLFFKIHGINEGNNFAEVYYHAFELGDIMNHEGHDYIVIEIKGRDIWVENLKYKKRQEILDKLLK